MPRTPRSREEIEKEYEDAITYLKNPEHISGLKSGLILETLLDIRDAVMEGKEKKYTCLDCGQVGSIDCPCHRPTNSDK